MTVEIIGDTWSLLIVRDMIALGKCTFREFLESAERIGPGVLTDRHRFPFISFLKINMKTSEKR